MSMLTYFHHTSIRYFHLRPRLTRLLSSPAYAHLIHPSPSLGDYIHNIQRRNTKSQSDTAMLMHCGTDASRWEKLFFDLSKEGNASVIKRMLYKMQEKNITIRPIYRKYFFDACYVSKNASMAFNEIVNVNEKGSFDPKYASFALKTCGATGSHEYAMQILSIIQSNGFPLVRTHCESYMSSYSSVGNIDETLRVFGAYFDSSVALTNSRGEPVICVGTLSPTISTYNILLSACANDSNYVKAQEIFDSIRNMGLIPDDQSHCTLLSAAVRANHIPVARELLEKMVVEFSKGIPYTVNVDDGGVGSGDNNGTVLRVAYKPSSRAFNTLLMAYCKDNDSVGMKEIYSQMIQLGAPFDMHTYSILITAASRGMVVLADSTQAELFSSCTSTQLIENTMENMLQLRPIVIPSSAVWGTASAHYKSSGDYENLRSLVQLVSSYDPYFDTISGVPVCRRQNHQLRREGSGSASKPRVCVMSMLRQATSNKKHMQLPFLQKSDELFYNTEDIRAIKDKWRELRAKMWLDLITTAGKAGKISEAYATVCEMENIDGRVITDTSRFACWQRAVRAASTSSTWQDALNVMADMRSRQLVPNSSTWSCVLTSCAEGSGVNDVSKLLVLMYDKDNLFPDAKTWNALIDILDVKSGVRQTYPSSGRWQRSFGGECSTGTRILTSTSNERPYDLPVAYSNLEQLSASKASTEMELLQTYVAACPPNLQAFIVGSLTRSFDGSSVVSGRVKVWLKRKHKEFVGRGQTKGIDLGRYSSDVHTLSCKSNGRTGQISDGNEFGGGGSSGDLGDFDGSDGMLWMDRIRTYYTSNDLKGCVATGDALVQAVENNRLNEPVTVDFFELIMDICSRNCMHNKVLTYGKCMDNLNIDATKQIYGCLISSYAFSGEEDTAMDIAQKVLISKDALGVTEHDADALFYSLIQAILLKHDIVGAENLLNLLEGHGLRSNNLYASLVQSYVASGEIEKSLALVDTWTRHCVPAGKLCEDTCKSLLTLIFTDKSISYMEKWSLAHRYSTILLTRNAQVVEVHGVYLESILKEKQSYLPKYINTLTESSQNIDLWEDLMHRLCQHGLDEECMWVIQCMGTTGKTPSISIECWKCLIEALCEKGKLLDARDTCMFMSSKFCTEVAQSEGISEYVVAPETEHYESENNISDLENDATSRRVHDDLVTCWHSVFRIIGSKGEYEMGLKLLDNMRSVGLQPDEECWSGVIRAALLVRNPKGAISAMKTLCEVDDISCPSSEKIYGPILDYLAEHDLPRDIVTVIRDMESRNVTVDKATWKKIERMRRFDTILDAFEKY